MPADVTKPMPPGRWETVDPHDLPATPVLGDEPETKEILSSASMLDDEPAGEIDPEEDFETSPSAANQDDGDGLAIAAMSRERSPTIAPTGPSGGAGMTRDGASNPVDAASPGGSTRPDPARIVQRQQSLEHHLRGNPTDLDAFRELAAIYRDQDRPIEARRVLKQALEVFPEDADLLWEYEESVLARSLQLFREVRDLASRLQTPETDRELRRATQDWAMRRIEVCRARLTREPTKVHLNVQLGEAHYDAEEYTQAIEVLSRVVDQHAWAPAAYLMIGKCHAALGHDAEAMAALRACALRRAVPAPPRIRSIALQLLVDNAERLGIPKTAEHYRAALQDAQQAG
ncbi:MAG: tetratricopeptide repeat protein [Planctomycetota bacterium]